MLSLVALTIVLAACSSPGYVTAGDDGSSTFDSDSSEGGSNGARSAPANPAPVNPAPAPGGDSVDPSAIVGTWSASDGSATKVIDGSGRCSGMYWNNGTPLDIGGPMQCTLGSQQASDGSYALVVQQPPNQATYIVTFHRGNFTLVSGGVAITLTRQ